MTTDEWKSLWQRLTYGIVRVVDHGIDDTHCWLDFAQHGKGLSEVMRTKLERFLKGQSLKSLSYEFDCVTSSTSSHLASALQTLGIGGKAASVPASVVLFANAAFDKLNLHAEKEESGERFRVTIKRPRHALASLTPHVRRVAEMRFEGKTPGQISSTLGKAVKTIDNQIAIANKKLGVSTRLELIIHLGANEP